MQFSEAKKAMTLEKKYILVAYLSLPLSISIANIRTSWLGLTCDVFVV